MFGYAARRVLLNKYPAAAAESFLDCVQSSATSIDVFRILCAARPLSCFASFASPAILCPFRVDQRGGTEIKASASAFDVCLSCSSFFFLTVVILTRHIHNGAAITVSTQF